MKEKLDKELDQLLKPYTGIWLSLSSLWEPRPVSSQLALCLSSLLFSVHLLFSSLLWSPWQKQGLFAALNHPDTNAAIEKNVNMLSGKVPVTQPIMDRSVGSHLIKHLLDTTIYSFILSTTID